MTVDEILSGVRIALGEAPLGVCPAADCNGVDAVGVDAILEAVQSTLRGCLTREEIIRSELDRMVERNCGCAFSGSSCDPVHSRNGVFSIRCFGWLGHEGSGSLAAFATVQEAKLAFDGALPSDARTFEIGGYLAAEWYRDDPRISFVETEDHYVVWQPGCWLFRFHFFDDTGIRLRPIGDLAAWIDRTLVQHGIVGPCWDEGRATPTASVTPSPVATPTATPVLPDLRFVSVDEPNLAQCRSRFSAPVVHACVGARDGDVTQEFSVSIGRSSVWQVPGLDAGAVACLSAPMVHSASLVIDAPSLVLESDEANNEYSVLLPTLTPLPDCTPTPTRTPTLVRVGCCEWSTGGCTTFFRADVRECFPRGALFSPDYRCDDQGAACVLRPTPTPPPTVTPASLAPDLVPLDPIEAGFTLGCPARDCLLLCVRNDGVADSPAFGVKLGDEWDISFDGLPRQHQSCRLAPNIEGGVVTVDPGGTVGESDETNNTVSVVWPSH